MPAILFHTLVFGIKILRTSFINKGIFENLRGNHKQYTNHCRCVVCISDIYIYIYVLLLLVYSDDSCKLYRTSFCGTRYYKSLCSDTLGLSTNLNIIISIQIDSRIYNCIYILISRESVFLKPSGGNFAHTNSVLCIGAASRINNNIIVCVRAPL